MNFSQPLLLLAMLFCMSSCNQEQSSTSFSEADLIGHWNITVPGGLQFIEFIDDHRILIGDRGAIADKHISKHYYETYSVRKGEVSLALPADVKLTNIIVEGDRMTFDFINPTTGYDQVYFADRVTDTVQTDETTAAIFQSWTTVQVNAKKLKPEEQKLAYFSKSGIYFLKNLEDEELHLYSWDWRDSNNKQLCFSDYQRPSLVPQEACMFFEKLTDNYAIFQLNDDRIKMVRTSSI